MNLSWRVPFGLQEKSKETFIISLILLRQHLIFISIHFEENHILQQRKQVYFILKGTRPRQCLRPRSHYQLFMRKVHEMNPNYYSNYNIRWVLKADRNIKVNKNNKWWEGQKCKQTSVLVSFSFLPLRFFQLHLYFIIKLCNNKYWVKRNNYEKIWWSEIKEARLYAAVLLIIKSHGKPRQGATMVPLIFFAQR